MRYRKGRVKPLPRLRFHNQTKNGYCKSCRSYKCYKSAYIPKYSYIWSWEEVYIHIQIGGI
jgi:hypothetical protein